MVLIKWSKQIGVVAFQLQLPEHAHIHPIFHVSQLKLVVGDHPVEVELSAELQGHSNGVQPHQELGRD